MTLAVREMRLEEVGLIIDYFYESTPQHLEVMGVDPTRLPNRRNWQALYGAEYEKPRQNRSTLLVVWELDGKSVGFSTSDKITYGEQAHIHLHIVDSSLRASGIGSRCLRETVQIYFHSLRVKRLLCEPNAYNVAPNRTLQRVGFRYVKTYNTVPGPLNYYQPVTRWILERTVGPLEDAAE
jgi:RimJ/RimL family protein N-acetyltransferase